MHQRCHTWRLVSWILPFVTTRVFNCRSVFNNIMCHHSCCTLNYICEYTSLGIIKIINNIFFFKSFWRTHVLFWGPLVPLFWISGDVSSGFQSQSGFCLIRYFCGGKCNKQYQQYLKNYPCDVYMKWHRSTSILTVVELLKTENEEQKCIKIETKSFYGETNNLMVINGYWSTE